MINHIDPAIFSAIKKRFKITGGVMDIPSFRDVYGLGQLLSDADDPQLWEAAALDALWMPLNDPSFQSLPYVS